MATDPVDILDHLRTCSVFERIDMKGETLAQAADEIEHWQQKALELAGQVDEQRIEIQRLDADAANERAERQSWQAVAHDHSERLKVLGEKLERIERLAAGNVTGCGTCSTILREFAPAVPAGRSMTQAERDAMHRAFEASVDDVPAKSWTAGDGPCDCEARDGKLWHSASCSSLRPPAVDVPTEPKPCEHLHSDLLAEKQKDGEPLFQMRKCLDCEKTFRVRTSVTRRGDAT